MYHFDWIRRHAERTPEQLAVIDGTSGQHYSYAAWDTRITRLAHVLQDELGLRRGDRLAILAQNSLAFYEVLFACARIGAILTTLNWRLTAPELAFILGDSTPAALIYEADFADTVAALAAETAGLAQLRMGAAYEAALAQAADTPLPELRLPYDATWAIIYTSGTTGRPKGAQVTYGNFFYNAVGMGQAIGLTFASVNLNVLPTFHIGGLGLYACPTWHAGGTVVVMRAFDGAQLLDLIARYRVTHLLLVPAIYMLLAEQPQLATADLRSVVHWGSGGSALPPALVQRYAARGIIIQQGFGMTETGPTVFIIDRDQAIARAGSVGKAVLHVDVRIEDEHGNVLGPEMTGELCVRGGNVTSGYWNRPDATAEAIVNGWLHTGDAARYDRDGYYYIVDRWKDMFISGGENVYPAEVENVFYQHPAVGEVAVIGVPHAKWQEVGRAIVVVKSGMATTEAALIDFCRDKLAKYKLPRSVVFVDAPLPRTAAGKVLKRVLRQQYGESAV